MVTVWYILCVGSFQLSWGPVLPPVSRLSAPLAGVDLHGEPYHWRMEGLTEDHHGCCDGVSLHRRPAPWRMVPAAVCAPRVSGGGPDAPGAGGGSVLRRAEGPLSAPLPAWGRLSAACSGADHQPHGPLHGHGRAATQVQAEQWYEQEQVYLLTKCIAVV